MSELRIQIPQKCLEVLSQPGARYRILHGGRGSAKSWSIAKYLVAKAANETHRILCVREMQNSIRDSVYRLLVDQIHELKLTNQFLILRDAIRSLSGSEFLFKGIRHNIAEIKSTEGITICWAEEAEKISEESWSILIPTIRREGSEILISFNPEDENSATNKRFIQNTPPDSAKAEVNFVDNPWFPEVLRKEMEYDKRVDYEKYEHVWLGKPKKYATALIFRGKVFVEEFATPEGIELYYGADFGFSVDPSVLVRMFIQDNKLYIDYEAYGVGVEIDDLEQFYDSVPGSRKWKITADSERPDTISYLSQRGFHIIGAEKGKGSVEDGIEFIRAFEAIIIHPRCRGAADNFLNYKWKQDRITEEILPIPASGSDHVPDACRYALERFIKNKVSVFDLDYSAIDLYGNKRR